MKIKDEQLILNHTELIALEGMLEDLPYYLSLDNVHLSATSSIVRKEILVSIKKISEAK